MSERDFSDFYLGDDVYELAGGVIPEIAGRLDVELSTEPNSRDLGALVGKIGPNKVLRDNAEITAIDRDAAVALVETSGVQRALDRSLWTPKVISESIDVAIVTGAVANWQDRAVEIVESGVHTSTPVIVATGNRVMDSASEKNNANVIRFNQAFGHYPTETEYASEFVRPRLLLSHPIDYIYEEEGYDTGSGDEIAEQLFEQNQHLLEKRIGFVRVANAGVQLAVQMRTAARAVEPAYDSSPENPQAFILTDTFPLAETEEQEEQPQSYQKAKTALRQLAITAKMLHEAAGGE